MKPFIQKLPLSNDISFVAKTFRTPNFEVSWHQHIEYELILFTEGSGMSFVGNHVGEFETGDIYFLGSNLPHTFQKRHPDIITSAVVVQFKEDFWGKDFLDLPESRLLRALFNSSQKGLKVCGNTLKQLRKVIEDMEYTTGFRRILQLGECLHTLSFKKDYIELSTHEVNELNLDEKEKIDKIFNYTIDNFKEPIELTTVAAIANMSISAFCNYFKKSTKKTYFDFLNEVRVGYACKLMIETNMSILEICYESGFNTVANFNKQFLKIKKAPPSRYRKHFVSETSTRTINDDLYSVKSA